MIEEVLTRQLSKMEISNEFIQELQVKDGVYVYRVKSDKKKYVIKYFEKEEYRREISNYLILQGLGITTIPLIGFTDCAILMEDIKYSNQYRLANPDDMNDPVVCAKLAEWYRMLHELGKSYIICNGTNMYMETDCITRDNLLFIKDNLKLYDNPVWSMLDEHLDDLLQLIDKTTKTLTYNDFYYTNMIVAKDKSKAFMFDYNLLGKGYIAADIKNVSLALGEDAKVAFLTAYGEINQEEVLLHEVAGNLVALYYACSRDVFPEWGKDEVELIKNGYLLKCLKKMLT